MQVGFVCELSLEELLTIERNNPNPLLSDGRLTLPRQLCNYGVQAWGRNWAKNKQGVVIREGPLRINLEVERKRRGGKLVDETNFTSLGIFLDFCNCG